MAEATTGINGGGEHQNQWRRRPPESLMLNGDNEEERKLVSMVRDTWFQRMKMRYLGDVRGLIEGCFEAVWWLFWHCLAAGTCRFCWCLGAVRRCVVVTVCDGDSWCVEVRMAERGRATSQNVPNDLLAQMLEVLQGMNENLRNLNRSVAPGPGSLSQSGFTPNAAVEWAPGMGCTNMKAYGVATSKSNFPKNFGPQRNFVHGKGKGKMFPEKQKPCFPLAGNRRVTVKLPILSMNAMGTGRPQSIGRVVTMCGAETSELDSLTRCGMYEEKVNESQRSYALTGVRRNRGYQGSKPTVPTEGVSTPMCNQCGRLHYGSTCPGKGNGCFQCKEFGHIKRYCPKLDRRPKVMHAEEASDHGRTVTPSGTGTSGVDDPTRGKSHGNSADKVVAVGGLCEISGQASGMGPMSAKRVRNPLKKKEGEILEDSRLSESCLAWARNDKLGLLTLVRKNLVPPGPAEYQGLDEFCRRNPSQFHGGFAPDAALEWIQGMERIFWAMNCSEAQKLAYATYMLVTEGENWWEFTTRQMEMEELLISWSTFKAKFLQKYFPADLKREKEMEFLKLEQGNMPKLKMMFRHQEIADFANLVNKCRMYEDDVKVDELATLETLSPRNYGPQRNRMWERGKEIVEDDRKPYATPTGHRDRNFQGSRPPTFPTGEVSTHLCNKCGGLRHGSTCPGSDNKCFYCKELGHIKRYCTKLSRWMNVVHAERARAHSRAVTPKGAGTSGVDDPRER
ncbi:hypothetical protein Lal_00013413 [Lupinus albus]|nr:hypothetical protein Lal_00013413 [Lupinus albus]